ncbi:aldolase/citrate lyase family protein [Dactylosporangium sp. NPDC051485]|uniref:aldolase/citrate lyase family protein n=1 Tax=Dactylosporangium sp. NPDC051485 TaxID=3154846 RepID=UPI0034474EF0
MRTKMFSQLASGGSTYGAFTLINQPEVVEIMGSLGLDFMCMDMMLGALDWRTASAMALAAERYGMSTMIRVPSYPWSGRRDMVDHHIATDVLRAVSIGADVVMASLETPEQVASALHPTTNSHRRIYLPKFEFEAHGTPEERAGLDEQTANEHAHAWLLPLIESRLAAEQLEDIVTVDGLQAVFLGMSDLANEFGHPNDYTHPEMDEMVQRAVEQASKHSVAVFVNIMGAGTGPARVQEAVARYEQMGVRGFFLPFDSAILIRFYRDVMSTLRPQ